MPAPSTSLPWVNNKFPNAPLKLQEAPLSVPPFCSSSVQGNFAPLSEANKYHPSIAPQQAGNRACGLQRHQDIASKNSFLHRSISEALVWVLLQLQSFGARRVTRSKWLRHCHRRQEALLSHQLAFSLLQESTHRLCLCSK